jgi:hypothetical protein
MPGMARADRRGSAGLPKGVAPRLLLSSGPAARAVRSSARVIRRASLHLCRRPRAPARRRAGHRHPKDVLVAAVRCALEGEAKQVSMVVPGAGGPDPGRGVGPRLPGQGALYPAVRAAVRRLAPLPAVQPRLHLRQAAAGCPGDAAAAASDLAEDRAPVARVSTAAGAVLGESPSSTQHGHQSRTRCGPLSGRWQTTLAVRKGRIVLKNPPLKSLW